MIIERGAFRPQSATSVSSPSTIHDFDLFTMACTPVALVDGHHRQVAQQVDPQDSLYFRQHAPTINANDISVYCASKTRFS